MKLKDMRYKEEIRTEDCEPHGTHLVGYVFCSYDVLYSTFGSNGRGDNYKVDACWSKKVICDSDKYDGFQFTIYNWKDGKNYCGKEGSDLRDIGIWHIGGKTSFASEIVEEALRQNENYSPGRDFKVVHSSSPSVVMNYYLNKPQ